MCRYWDISLILCFSVMFVGAEKVPDQLPPPKNVNFKWETPFTLHVRWEEPEDLDPTCKVNYTLEVHHGQGCQNSQQLKRTTNLNYTLNVSNENGLCITVTTNPENCGNKRPSLASSITIPPPPVMLMSNLTCIYYSENNMNCTWTPDGDVKDLTFYYWLPMTEPVKNCSSYINEMNGCHINSDHLSVSADAMFYMFKGTYKGIPVINTIKGKYPRDNVKLKKPELKIKRDEKQLFFQTIKSDFEQFHEDCFVYKYRYSICDVPSVADEESILHFVDYDPACEYRASVQIMLRDSCGKGESDPSDEVKYGENRNRNLPVLLAVIITPLVVSCCLIGCLVLLRRHKDDILPKIPDPSLFFKDMLSSNMRMTEDLTNPAVGRLYVPIEESVESRISLEPESSFLHKGP